MLPPMHWCTNNTSADALVHQQYFRRCIGAPTILPPMHWCTNNTSAVTLVHQQYLLWYGGLVHQFTGLLTPRTRRYGAESSKGNLQPTATHPDLVKFKSYVSHGSIPLVHGIGSWLCHQNGPIETWQFFKMTCLGFSSTVVQTLL